MKALIVDDSMVMRKILIGALSQAEIKDVDQATDGAQAVTMAGKNEYDLVLMDWNMPNKTGIEALTEIRKSGNKVPIIMVTTEAEKARVVAAIKAGANNYIVKPFTPETVAEKIKTVLSKASS